MREIEYGQMDFCLDRSRIGGQQRAFQEDSSYIGSFVDQSLGCRYGLTLGCGKIQCCPIPPGRRDELGAAIHTHNMNAGRVDCCSLKMTQGQTECFGGNHTDATALLQGGSNEWDQHQRRGEDWDVDDVEQVPLKERGKAARRGNGLTALILEVASAGEPRLDLLSEFAAIRIERGQISYGSASRKSFDNIVHHRERERRGVPNRAGRPREATFDHQYTDPMTVDVVPAPE
nr:hypothetical protein [Bradyrhizobium vignae]